MESKGNTMDSLSRKHFILLLVPLIFISVLSPSLIFVTAKEGSGGTGRLIKVVEAQSGSDSLTFGGATEPMPSGGYNFSVKILLEGDTRFLATYQVTLSFNRSMVNCTAASINKTDPSFVFYKYRSEAIVVSPEISNGEGWVSIGASLVWNSVNVSSGLLCQLNFKAIKTGTFTIAVRPSNSWGYDYMWDSYLLDINQHEYSVSPSLGQPAPPYFDLGSLSGSVSAFSSPPIVSFTVKPEYPEIKQNVTFDASGSFDPDGEIVSYAWNFGDNKNQTSALNSAIHAFASAGTYNVTLTVFDNDNYNSSLSSPIRVGRIPRVNFTFSPPEPQRFESITFNASGSFDTDGNITQYIWDFGDNRTSGILNTTDPTVTVPGYVYPGVYMVNLTIYDNDGLYNFTTTEIFAGKRPIISFEFDPLDPAPDQNITFTASVQLNEAGDDILLIRVLWDFGDFLAESVSDVNATDTTIDPFTIVHTYREQGGVYSVNLTVIDMYGLYASYYQDVNVTIVKQHMAEADNTLYYIAAAAIIAVIVVAGVFVSRRQKPELARKERYRVI